jgi:hypothetical protein
VSGWPAVALILAAEIAAAGWLVRMAARRWWDYLVISVVTIALVRPTAHHVTGDVSSYLPGAIWSDSSDGKDQIIIVSAASTVLWPLMATAFAVFIFRQIRSAAPDNPDGG